MEIVDVADLRAEQLFSGERELSERAKRGAPCVPGDKAQGPISDFGRKAVKAALTAIDEAGVSRSLARPFNSAIRLAPQRSPRLEEIG